MAKLATAISIPDWTKESGNYFAIFSGDTIRIFAGCPPRSNMGTQVSYQAFNSFYGLALGEGTQNISNNTFVFDSNDCDSSDSGPHGQIAITDNALDVLAYQPFKPFYFTFSILFFFWVVFFVLRLFFGKAW